MGVAQHRALHPRRRICPLQSRIDSLSRIVRLLSRRLRRVHRVRRQPSAGASVGLPGTAGARAWLLPGVNPCYCYQSRDSIATEEIKPASHPVAFQIKSPAVRYRNRTNEWNLRSACSHCWKSNVAIHSISGRSRVCGYTTVLTSPEQVAGRAISSTESRPSRVMDPRLTASLGRR